MARKIIPYKPYLKKIAQGLRNNSSSAEVFLWLQLKGKQMKGYDFHRQKPLLNYIVDFYCHELNLAIEIDGITHYEEDVAVNDIVRQHEIEKFGVSFLRFTNEAIYKNMPGVLQAIEEWILDFEKKTHP